MEYYWSVLLGVYLSCLFIVSCDQHYDTEEEHTTNTIPVGGAPYFKDPPETKFVALIGEEVKIQCKGYGVPKPFLVWYKNNIRLANYGHSRIEIRTKSIRIYKAEVEDSGVYTCHLSNRFGEQWINYTLLVANETEIKGYFGVPDNREYKYRNLRSPAAKVKPQWSRNLMDFIRSKISYVTSYIELNCPARGSPKPTTLWFKDGVQMHQNMSGRITFKRYSLVIVDLVLKDEGNYTCVVSNIHGSLNWTYELTVLQRALYMPVFEQPKNQSVRVGETAIFSCRINFRDTHPHIHWLKHHQINESYTIENGEQYFQVIQTPSIYNSSPEVLILHNVTKEDEAMYTCLVRNAIGTSYKSAYLEVIDAEMTPQTTVSKFREGRAPEWLIIILVAVFVLVLLSVLSLGLWYRHRLRKPVTQRHMKTMIFTKQDEVHYDNKDPDAVSPLMTPQVRIVDKPDILSSSERGMRLSSDFTEISEYDLPVDSKWEIPRERHELGPRLGEEAFGLEVKNDSMCLLNNHADTTAAVKMLTTDASDSEKMDIILETETSL